MMMRDGKNSGQQNIDGYVRALSKADINKADFFVFILTQFNFLHLK